MYSKDTIAAVSTGLGEAAIGIVRLSGEDAVAIAERIFQGASIHSLTKLDSHAVAYGFVVDPQSGDKVDEVLLTLMRKPRSYTRENVVEINCHGGIQALRRTLELALRQGARLAEPGEFTKRAFLNGRLDLAQAEAVIDLIRAPGEAARRQALGQLEGRFSRKAGKVRDAILEVRASLEAVVDFPEEDIEPLEYSRAEEVLQESTKEIEEILARAWEGKVYREGVETAIIGRPNVGKSSILNALLKEERAIVAATPGTTRDVIEEIVNVKGISLKLKDTAGMRTPGNAVERIGVGLSRQALEGADLILFVLDQGSALSGEDRKLMAEIRDKKTIAILNKRDLPPVAKREEIEKMLKGTPVVETSALTGEGIEALEEAIKERVFEGRPQASDSAITCNLRHQRALEEAVGFLREARSALEARESEEIICSSLAESLDALGVILGETTSEDLLDSIFSRFCIGK